MRLLVGVLVAVTSFLTAVTSGADPSIAGGGGTAQDDPQFVHRMVFDVPLVDFSAFAASRTGPDGARGDTWFDWSTDTCSAPLVGNTGRSFDFTEPCRRHDFGYRNSQLLDHRYGTRAFWNGAVRLTIDQQFLSDMRQHCRVRRLIDRPTCHAWASTFYRAVRWWGGP